MNSLTERVAELSPAKRQLLLQRLNKEAASRARERSEAPAFVPVERNGDLPLSFAQQRLWFLDQLEPGNPVYNIPTGVRIKGDLNVSALSRSIDEIVARHESLRTSFPVTNDGEPLQVIAANLSGILRVVDLSEIATAEAVAQQLAKTDASRPFDLAQGRILRTTLIRLSEQEHVVLLTLHHIVSDGWSTAVLIGELSALYEAFSNGRPSPLPPLAMQYADYAHWQREWL